MIQMTTQTTPTEAKPAKPRPRKKHRVFLWVFLAIQVIFIAWLIAGVVKASQGPDAAKEAARYCSTGAWHLYGSYAQCVSKYGDTLRAAGNLGSGIGVGLILGLWALVDFLVAVPYAIYRLASRKG